jgi:excisionase family DNA binding protein
MGAPALYTVEEAAKVLRIGRTKAYALTQEWRATDGRSGLPVVDFGHVLRVPRAALEELLGVDLPAPAPTPPSGDRRGGTPDTGALQGEAERAVTGPVVPAPSRRSPKRRSRAVTSSAPADQLGLFDTAS